MKLQSNLIPVLCVIVLTVLSTALFFYPTKPAFAFNDHVRFCSDPYHHSIKPKTKENFKEFGLIFIGTVIKPTSEDKIVHTTKEGQPTDYFATLRVDEIIKYDIPYNYFRRSQIRLQSIPNLSKLDAIECPNSLQRYPKGKQLLIFADIDLVHRRAPIAHRATPIMQPAETQSILNEELDALRKLRPSHIKVRKYHTIIPFLVILPMLLLYRSWIKLHPKPNNQKGKAQWKLTTANILGGFFSLTYALFAVFLLFNIARAKEPCQKINIKAWAEPPVEKFATTTGHPLISQSRFVTAFLYDVDYYKRSYCSQSIIAYNAFAKERENSVSQADDTDMK